MALGKQLRVEAVRGIGSGGIGSDYTAVGPITTRPNCTAVFQNLTDQPIMLSFDGVVDHIPFNAGSAFTYDITTNKAVPDGLFISVGTQFYVKQIGVPTTGNFYISLFYARD